MPDCEIRRPDRSQQVARGRLRPDLGATERVLKTDAVRLVNRHLWTLHGQRFAADQTTAVLRSRCRLQALKPINEHRLSPIRDRFAVQRLDHHNISNPSKLRDGPAQRSRMRRDRARSLNAASRRWSQLEQLEGHCNAASPLHRALASSNACAMPLHFTERSHEFPPSRRHRWPLSTLSHQLLGIAPGYRCE